MDSHMDHYWSRLRISRYMLHILLSPDDREAYDQTAPNADTDHRPDSHGRNNTCSNIKVHSSHLHILPRQCMDTVG